MYSFAYSKTLRIISKCIEHLSVIQQKYAQKKKVIALIRVLDSTLITIFLYLNFLLSLNESNLWKFKRLNITQNLPKWFQNSFWTYIRFFSHLFVNWRIISNCSAISIPFIPFVYPWVDDLLNRETPLIVNVLNRISASQIKREWRGFCRTRVS